MTSKPPQVVVGKKQRIDGHWNEVTGFLVKLRTPFVCFSGCRLILWNAPSSPPGVFVGWICVSYQPDPSACAGSHGHGTIFSQSLRSILHIVLPGHCVVHAGRVCGLSGRTGT